METSLRVALIIMAVIFVAWLLYDWSKALKDRCIMVRKLEEYNEAFPINPWHPNYPKQPIQQEVLKNENRIDPKPKLKDKSSSIAALEINKKISEEEVLEVNERPNEEKVLEVNEKTNEEKVLEVNEKSNEEKLLKVNESSNNEKAFKIKEKTDQNGILKNE